MEKIIRVGNYEFRAKSTAASFLYYKQEFGRDAMADLLSFAGGAAAINTSDTNAMMSAVARGDFDFETFLRFAWVFARSADRNVKPFIDWLDDFEMPVIDFIMAVLPEMQELLFSQVQTTVAPKKN